MRKIFIRALAAALLALVPGGCAIAARSQLPSLPDPPARPGFSIVVEGESVRVGLDDWVALREYVALLERDNILLRSLLNGRDE